MRLLFGQNKLLLIFILFSLVLGIILALPSYYAYEKFSVYFVERQALPVIDALIETENLSREAWERGKSSNIDSGDLANVMGWTFLVGKQIPNDWNSFNAGMHFLSDEKKFVYIRSLNNTKYALSGSISEFLDLRNRFVLILLLFVVIGLFVSIFLAILIAKREKEIADFAFRESLFTGDVGHELRTPLAVLQGGLEILSNKIGKNNEVKVIDKISRMQKTVFSMTNTVNTLLILARKSENLNFESINISNVCNRVIYELCNQNLCNCNIIDKELNDNKPQLSANIESNVIKRAQESLVAIVCRNLLENACKYTENGNVSFIVTNKKMEIINGGIFSEYLPIFENEKLNKNYKNISVGSGLGLSLTYRACEMLGWKLKILRNIEKNETIIYVIM